MVSCPSMVERRVLLVGFGGVGRAFAGLLLGHPLGETTMAQLEGVWVLDRAPSPLPPHPKLHPLPALDLRSGAQLEALLAAHKITDVIELAYVGTFDCVQVCAAAGVNYLSTSLETWPEETPDRAADHNLTLPDARNLLPGLRPATVAGSHLIGAGMNPGVVNALAFVGLRRFAEAAGVETSELAVRGVTITEVDTTEAPGPIAPGFACTWSPLGCLDELHEPSSMIVRAREIIDLAHAPLHANYRARCGSLEIVGHAVPHDEQVTLGEYFTEAEVAFVYRLPPAARHFLAAPPDGEPETFRLVRLYPPSHTKLRGSDTVGVLLTSASHGEFWIGFETACSAAAAYGTNATELQVAAGVLAGFGQHGTVAGIHTVEELDPERFIADVEAVLGPALVYFDAHAPARTFAERRVKDTGAI